MVLSEHKSKKKKKHTKKHSNNNNNDTTTTTNIKSFVVIACMAMGFWGKGGTEVVCWWLMYASVC